VGRSMLRPYEKTVVIHRSSELPPIVFHVIDDVRILSLMKITRRFLSFLLLCAPLPPLSTAAQNPKPAAKDQYLAFGGTYTTKTNSKGIYAFRYDGATGKLTSLGVAAETADPSFLAIHPNGKYLYAVNEAGKASMVSAFALDKANGRLSLLNQLPALGEDPCYISLDRTGNYIFVANYTSGNVVVFPIGADGKLGAATANVRDEGALGPNKERQDGPHAHWVENFGSEVFVADLGLDRVLVYRFNPGSGALSSMPAAGSSFPFPQGPLELSPGTGPRHVALSRSGRFMYILGELDSTVTRFVATKEGVFNSALGKYPMLPPGFSGRNDAAEINIHPNGRFLYASNRGHDSIVVYSIDQEWGKLTQVADVPTGGKEPRHFAIDPTGKYLLAENQFSDNIVVFRIDPASGQISPTGDSVSVPSPVDLVFLPAD